MSYLIATISDIHFGAFVAEDLYFELDRVFLKTLKKMPKLDAIIINGDTFDSKISLESKTSKYCFKFFNELMKIAKKKNSKIRVIKGTESHDHSQLDNFVVLENSEDVDFRIIRTVEEEDLFHDFKVLYVPEEYMKNPKEYYKEYFEEDNRYNAVFGHGMFRECSMHEQDGEVQRNEAPIFDVKTFDRICKGPTIFGHYHIMTNLYNSVFYTGSFSRWCQGEEGDKGFFIVGINTDTNEYMVVPVHNYIAKKYITKTIDKIVSKFEVEKIISLINDYIELNNIYKFRMFVNDPGDQVISSKIAIIKKYFSDNKHITLKVISQAQMMEEEHSQKIIDQYHYLFDKKYEVEQKLQMFIKDQFQYDITEQRIKDLLFSDNDILSILNKMEDD